MIIAVEYEWEPGRCSYKISLFFDIYKGRYTIPREDFTFWIVWAARTLDYSHYTRITFCAVLKNFLLTFSQLQTSSFLQHSNNNVTVPIMEPERVPIVERIGINLSLVMKVKCLLIKNVTASFIFQLYCIWSFKV